MGYRFGIDVGGTFTDVVLQNEETGEVQFVKVDSTPQDQSIGIVNGIQSAVKKYRISFEETTQLIHGTTVATNAVLEQKGGKTLLLTTEGFGDILEVARQIRPKLYDSWARKPDPLIPRHRVFEIPERITHDGQILRELDVKRAGEILTGLGESVQPDAIVISLLHSYKNPIHERYLKELAQTRYPEIPVFASHEVHPLIREYERTSTVVINAYITPRIKRYIRQLVDKLRAMNYRRDIYVMQANGGMISTQTAETMGMYTILSGPAAGVLGGSKTGDLAGFKNVITFDMGGTSADVSLVRDGKKEIVSSTEIGGHPLSVTTININTVGAGGGSIAWIDAGGTLRVGPQSAGADPGPVSYGKGGEEPTVTDANLVIGVIDPDNFLGGEKKLHKEKAYKAIGGKVAQPLAMSVEDVASGIIHVVNANMVRAIRVISVESGHDPREFALVAFGGAGPMHAAAVADELNIPTVIIPVAPGILSAYGCLVADVQMDYGRTYISRINNLDISAVNGIYASMEENALDLMKREKVGEGKVTFVRSADMRYVGQAYELSVPFPQGVVTERIRDLLAQEFHRIHEVAYGYFIENETIEIINLRLTAMGEVPKPSMPKNAYSRPHGETLAHSKKERRVYFKGTWHKTSVFNRADLMAGDCIDGPAIVEGRDSTAVIPPGKNAQVDLYGNIIVDMR